MDRKDLIEYLSGFVSENRFELFQKIVARRTRYITLVLEDIYQSQNASAVLRTADCFGIQDVHIIENSNKYDVNPDVALGSDKWLTMHKYNSTEHNTLEAFNELRDRGYRIVATTPHNNDVELGNFDLSKGKAAFVFGTELRGLSDTAIKNADEYLKIPMYGFTESFNISVSAAIISHHLSGKLYKSGIDWMLSDTEKEDLILNWLRKTIKSSALLEKQFMENS
ncbi:MAG: RNA methyltransferase, partial [Eudoraea sp.]|nr:RNA methyltransferase [Eudoraea sp.]